MLSSNLISNFILNSDSYKMSHYLQYPKGTEAVSSYIESRGGDYKRTVFFGLQMFLKELEKPITFENIDEAEKIVTAHGLPFNREGWEYIVRAHSGYLPVEIHAVKEGTVLPTHNVLVQVVNTDPRCFWLTSYIETALLRAVWYPVTVATESWHIKAIIYDSLLKSSDNPDAEIPFKLHDFGARGVSSLESAAIGGCAHLVNFKGTDTLSGLLYAREYYNEAMAGFSIPAAEHSTITAWGKENEVKAYENMVNQFGGKDKILAVVSDSYDIYNACSELWGKELKDLVVSNGARIVIRPDSGDPVEVVSKVIRILMDKFGYITNKKGYKLLPPYLRVIQGDGVNPDSIQEILDSLLYQNISTENIAFGMGGALLQKLNRDTLKFAMKANAIKIDGYWNDVWKSPVTDTGKGSKRGRLSLIKDSNGEFVTIRQDEIPLNERDYLEPVFCNGKVLRTQHFEEIRNIAHSYLIS